MEHSLQVRKDLKNELVTVFGKERVMGLLVEFLPNEDDMRHMTDSDHQQRHIFFMSMYILMAGITMLALELLRVLLNCCTNRSNDPSTQPVKTAQETGAPRVPSLDAEIPLLDKSQETSEPEPEVEEEEEAIREHVRSYGKQDLFFIAYQHIYIFLCLSLLSYGFFNDYLCPSTGLDYELYFPWFIGTAMMHYVTLFVAFVKQPPTSKGLPSVWMAVPKTLNPFDGHLGTLRDAVAAGIYAQHAFVKPFQSGPLVLSFICAVCIFLPNVIIYTSIHPFRDFQELFWPILIQADRAHLKWSDKTNKNKDEKDEEQPSSCSCAGLKKRWEEEMSSWWVTVLKAMDAQTREHKQVVAIFGDLPQAVVGCIFMKVYVKRAEFILLVTVLASIKTALVVIMRPRILCCMANNGIQWQHLTWLDVTRAVRCTSGCEPVHRSRACRGLLKDPETSPAVRLCAIKALARLHGDIKNKREQPSAQLMKKESKERQSIKETILWEYATSEDKHIFREAEQALGKIARREAAEKEEKKDGQTATSQAPDWSEAGHLMKRVRSHDLNDRAHAAATLATKHPGYANAYKRDLVCCASMKLPPVPQRQQQQQQSSTWCLCSMKDCCGLWSELEEEDVESGGAAQDGSSKSLKERMDEAEKQREHDADMKEAEKKREQVLKVRDSAARALGALGDHSRIKQDKETKEDKETRERVECSVATVAPDVIKLLDHKDEDLRMSALTAVVHFHGKAAVKALHKALELLRKGENLLVAEILLIELLRHAASEAEEPCAQDNAQADEEEPPDEWNLKAFVEDVARVALKLPERQKETSEEVAPRVALKVCDKRGKSEEEKSQEEKGQDDNSRQEEKSQAARRVLFRTGGVTAKVIKEVLEELSPDLDKHEPELMHVLDEQTNGAGGLDQELLLALGPEVQSMNLRLHPDKDDLKKVDDICEAMKNQNNIFTLLKQSDAVPKKSDFTDTKDSTLAVFLTDLEPDDILCIMEVCSFLKDTYAKPCKPLIVFCVDFGKKDVGRIFVLKLMLAALLVGQADYKILVPQAMAPPKENPKGGFSETSQPAPAVAPPRPTEKDEQPGCSWFPKSAKSDRPQPTTSSTSDTPGAAPRSEERRSSTDSNKDFAEMQQRVTNMHSDNIKAIQKRINDFNGKEVRFYVCAPGRGNLGEIVDGLETEEITDKDGGKVTILRRKPPRRVYLYSGSFNIKGMERADLDALQKLVETLNEKGKNEGVLTDVSKFPFFGYTDCHKVTNSFNSFALPSFTPRLSYKKKLVPAVWKRLNDTFNKTLIHPDKVFQVFESDLTDLKEMYNEGEIQAYAKELCTNPRFKDKIKQKKKTTVKAFACNSIDAPLCDQLLFVDHWAEKHRKDQAAKSRKSPALGQTEEHAKKSREQVVDHRGRNWLPAALVSAQEGAWVYDTLNAYTQVDHLCPHGLKARRPHMREAHSISALYQLQEAMQDYTFKFIDEQEEMTPAELEEMVLWRS